MAFQKHCRFYRDSKSLSIGHGIGFCDLDANRTICDGDLNFCEKPSDLMKYQERKSANKDKRQYPRFLLDLPLEHQVMGSPNVFGGIAINGSEEGFLIFSRKDMPIGTKLKIAILFPKEYELAGFEMLAEIIRKDIYNKENREGHQYGIGFVRILEEDHSKLIRLLSCGLPLEELSDNQLEV